MKKENKSFLLCSLCTVIISAVCITGAVVSTTLVAEADKNKQMATSVAIATFEGLHPDYKLIRWHTNAKPKEERWYTYIEGVTRERVYGAWTYESYIYKDYNIMISNEINEDCIGCYL